MSKIDYPLHHIKGVAFDIDGVLSPATVPVGDDGVPRRMTNLRDGYAIKLAVKNGMKVCVITGAKVKGLRERFEMLDVTDFYEGVGNKLEVLQNWMQQNDLLPDETAFVGDDVPDIQSMRYVGCGVAPADASTDVLTSATYITNAAGGYGVAREFLEEVLRDRRQWPIDDLAYS